jgi:hypothetical protein
LTTDKEWAGRTAICEKDAVEKMRMTAFSGVEDLHVEAMKWALWDAATAIISEGWA